MDDHLLHLHLDFDQLLHLDHSVDWHSHLTNLGRPAAERFVVRTERAVFLMERAVFFLQRAVFVLERLEVPCQLLYARLERLNALFESCISPRELRLENGNLRHRALECLPHFGSLLTVHSHLRHNLFDHLPIDVLHWLHDLYRLLDHTHRLAPVDRLLATTDSVHVQHLLTAGLRARQRARRSCIRVEDLLGARARACVSVPLGESVARFLLGLEDLHTACLRAAAHGRHVAVIGHTGGATLAGGVGLVHGLGCVHLIRTGGSVIVKVLGAKCALA